MKDVRPFKGLPTNGRVGVEKLTVHKNGNGPIRPVAKGFRAIFTAKLKFCKI